MNKCVTAFRSLRREGLLTITNKRALLPVRADNALPLVIYAEAFEIDPPGLVSDVTYGGEVTCLDTTHKVWVGPTLSGVWNEVVRKPDHETWKSDHFHHFPLQWSLRITQWARMTRCMEHVQSWPKSVVELVHQLEMPSLDALCEWKEMEYKLFSAGSLELIQALTTEHFTRTLFAQWLLCKRLENEMITAEPLLPTFMPAWSLTDRGVLYVEDCEPV